MIRRTAVLIGTSLIALAAFLGTASPAAAVTRAEKIAQLSAFTQTSVSSYNAWNAARLDKAAWTAYGFDWTTDNCSLSPDQPLGFDFRLSCQRHDFGYGNYQQLGLFAANKARLDDAFYADLQRKCATYNSVVRPACNSLAWTYYQAVSAFGGLGAGAVSQADLDRAAQLKATAEAKAAVSAGAR